MFKLKVFWLMAGVRETKREALRTSLIEAAKGRIEMSGLGGLRARDVAADAGCALGSLYTVFKDIDELILHVNSQTLARLRAALDLPANAATSPKESLVELACEYLKFAANHKKLWAALFDHRMPEGVAVPDWHVSELVVLFQYIAIPLAQLQPELGKEALANRSRTLFAAVHGIVSMSMEDRLVAVPLEELEDQLRLFVETFVKGMT